MNPITNVAATCTRLSPLPSPNISPRTSPWQSPVMAYKFSKTLSVPANEPHRVRRGSQDKRELFAYPDNQAKKDKTEKKKTKKIRFELNKNAKDKDKSCKTHAWNNKTSQDLEGHNKKKLKDVAKEIKTKESHGSSRKAQKHKEKDKGCILM